MELEELNHETEEAQIDQFVKKWFKMFHDGEITETHLMDRMTCLALQMREPDFKVSGKKEFVVSLQDIKPIPGGYIAIGRIGDRPLKVGEYLNNCRIEKIEAYGKEFEELAGLTAAITLKGQYLNLTMRDYMWEWSWRNKK